MIGQVISVALGVAIGTLSWWLAERSRARRNPIWKQVFEEQRKILEEERKKTPPSE